ncbi:MAG TPA: hypothetical protein EYG39_06465, partial [Rhodothermales bacterium]|nr:hypothetical protein [Rhodothermales bacterium]
MIEELLVDIVNKAIASGRTPESKDWPLAGLEQWGCTSVANTVSKGGDLPIFAVVLLRTILVGLDGRRAEKIFRTRIVRAGHGEWRGLILGAPALDATPLGLGHKVTIGGHYLSALDLTLPRLEADLVQKGLEGRMVASVGLGPASPGACCLDKVEAYRGLPLFLCEGGEAFVQDGPCGGGVLAASADGLSVPIVLDGDELVLKSGEAARVPAKALAPPGSGLSLSSNLAASVCAVGGEWDGREGMVCVLNVLQPTVTLERGDVVAAGHWAPAPRSDPALAAAASAAGGAPLAAGVGSFIVSPIVVADAPVAGLAPSVAHVWRDDDELHRIYDVDVPSAAYYVALEADMARRHPLADPHVLAHLAVVEPFLDVCITSGFSLGARKSAGNILQKRVQFLGELVGRDGRESLDLHVDAIRNFSIVEDAPGMRRFLGNFGWVRPHYPKEVAIALPALTAQLRKDAVWPMPAAGVSSQRAIQAMASRLVKLAVLDEVAAITQTRPLEQIADASGYGWGGTVYQLSPDRSRLNVLGQYAGLLTQAQSHWHPRRSEAFAQRQVARARRSHLGRIPAFCWTDHAHLIRDSTAADADYTIVRWLADIESDGSRLRNLSGRSAALGDALSRHDLDHARFLREQAHSLRQLTLEDLFDEYEDDGPQQWGLGSHALPGRPIAVPASCAVAVGDALAIAALGERRVVRVLVLGGACSEARSRRDLALLRKELCDGVPFLDFALEVASPAIDEGLCGEAWFSTPNGWADPVKDRKSLRRDALAAVSSVVRSIGPRGTELVVGIGQGAVVATLLARPRIVEAALAARVAQPAEGPDLSAAWHALRAILLVGPALFKTSSFQKLVDSVPEVLESPRPGEGFVPCFLRGGHSGPDDFEKEMALALPVVRVG